MSKISVLLSLLILSVTANAKIFKLDIETSYKDKKIHKSSNTQIVAQENDEFIVPGDNNSFMYKMKISQDPMKIKTISPAEKVSEALLIQATVYILENGNEKIVGKPEILTKLGEEAIFKTTSKEGENFELKVTPNLK